MAVEGIIAKIQQKRLPLAVFGIGYVGLPTAALFADAGFNVVAVDIKPEVVKAVNEGISPIKEKGLTELISRNVKSGRLKAALNSADIDAEAFLISVQTPIAQNLEPNLSFLNEALEKIKKFLKKGTIIVVDSTIPPGTIKNIKSKLEAYSGLKADTDFFLAYVPERIAPGNAIKEFIENARLVGGVGPKSTKVASELFKSVCQKIIETDAATAEIAKLAENTFRDVNIAFANQLALICEQHGADIQKVTELANTHPRVNIHKSGPGVGGPCLTKDPYLLIYGSKFGSENLIKNAREVNDYMPEHVVELMLHALKQTGKQIEKSKIAILGTAYKADVDDPRFSPSEPIIQKITQLGAQLVVYDPHCKTTFGAKTGNFLHEIVNGADCLIIMIDHKEFKQLNLNEIKELMQKNPSIVDGKGIIDGEAAKNIGFAYYGVGCGKSSEG